MRGSAPSSQWRVVARPEGLPLRIHAAARFTCTGAGSCCESGFLVRLTPREASAARRAASTLFPGDTRDPIRLVAAGEELQWALANQDGCPFLDDRHCLVHDTPAHPAPCRVFPYRFVVGAGQVHVSPSHRCGCGALDRGARVAEQREEIARRLAATPLVHAVEERTRIDSKCEVESGVAIEAIVRGVAGEAALDPFPLLDRVAAGLLEVCGEGRGERRRGRSAAAEAPDALFAAALDALDVRADVAAGSANRTRRVEGSMASDANRTGRIAGPTASDAGRAKRGANPRPSARGRARARGTTTLGVALAGAPHPKTAARLDDLWAAGLWEPNADVRAEVGRFVRDFLFGLEVYRFGTLAEGLLALGLAAARILRALPNDAPHPTARTRVMTWESALLDPRLARALGTGSGPLARAGADIEDARTTLAGLDAWSRSS